MAGRVQAGLVQAGRVQAGRVQAAHQSLHHFVAKAGWSDDVVLAAARACCLPSNGMAQCAR